MLKKNPFHKVPFIDDDGFCLAESGAIMRYLANKNKGKVAEHWYGGSDEKLSAKIDEYLHWQHTSVRKPCVDAFFPLFVSKQVKDGFAKSPLDAARHKSGKEELPKTVKHMVEYFLRDNLYFCGTEISIADLSAINELEQLKITGLEDLYLNNPKLVAWAKRVQARLGPHWDEAMERRNAMRDAFKKA